jgi:hypothetical protein
MTRKIPLTRGKFALVDDTDYAFLTQWKWHCSAKGYAVRNQWNPDTRKTQTIFMHKLIMNAPRGQIVDHINRDKLDNRRENLRFATRSQNARNRSSSRNGYKGVSPRDNGNYSASIDVDGQTFQLGTYADEETAARVYDAASEQFHGAFSSKNFPDETVTDEIREMMTIGLNRHTPGIDRQPRPVPVKRSSKYVGIGWKDGYWEACIIVKNKRIHVGYFDNEETAAYKRDRAVMLYIPYTGTMNFPDEWESHKQIIQMKHGEFPASEFFVR